ncbi:MAG: TonB-dependent receptor [Myxococcales bacterium]|nr:TonB-dependent receptor [Myxococcales bacterium]
MRPLRFAFFALMSLSVTAGAQEAAPPAPVVVPPRLLEFIEATYPPAAEEAGLEGRVLLALTIEADGAVTDVQVVRTAGHGFDEAAVEAVRRFRFQPATRDGEPAAVRIQYEYVFERRAPTPVEPEEPEDPRPAAGRLEGRLLGREDGQPIREAEVVVTSADGARRRATVRQDGRFVFDDLPPGTYDVAIYADDYDELSASETVASGEATDVTYRLSLYEVDVPDRSGAFGAAAVVDPPPREVVRRTIRREELTQIAGTRGDALRAVELLPGVGRPPFGAGQLIVRGAAPNDSQTFFEGIPVPLLYHFGGLTSVVNSRLLEQIDFVPGNFSARYGRKTGGILEVSFRDPMAMYDDRRFHGVAELSAIDASLLAEFPLGDNAAMALGVRRSTIDLVFQYILPDDLFSLTAAPVYYDYQAFVVWKPHPRHKLRILSYGASDRFGLFAGDSLSDNDANIRGNIDLTTRFHFVDLAWDAQLDARTELDVDFQVGTSLLQFALGDLVRFDARFNQTFGRAELRHRANDRVRLIAGLDMFITPLRLDFFGPLAGQGEGSGPQNRSTAELRDQSSDFSITGVAYRPAAYVESDLRPWPWLQVLMGLRLDYAKEIRQWAFDPRLATIFTVSEGYRIKAAAGMFSQPPEFNQSAATIGNPNLAMIRSSHFGLGADAEFLPGVRVGLDGFYKQLWDRVVSAEGGRAPFFDNAGIGRIYGLEVSGRVEPRPGRNFTGFLSYTLMRSERQDRPGEPWRLFDFDQTHIFTLAGNYKLPRNWSVGATLRFVSGNPTTPIVGSIADPANGTYLPYAGVINSVRNPLFNRFDLRIEKMWIFSSWRLAFFLDIQNLWNASNPEGLVFNYNYSQSVPLNGLPIIPAIGVRGEL